MSTTLDGSAPTLKGSAMTDLEATRLCAEAMGLEGLHPIEKVCPILKDGTVRSALVTKDWGDDDEAGYYDPLHDDAQAMALVKRFKLDCRNATYDADWASTEFEWEVEHNDGKQATFRRDKDLNRAIVMCVAAIREGSAK